MEGVNPFIKVINAITHDHFLDELGYVYNLSILTPKSFSIQNWKKFKSCIFLSYLPKQIISFDYNDNNLFLW